jgi:hypothetical protein
MNTVTRLPRLDVYVNSLYTVSITVVNANNYKLKKKHNPFPYNKLRCNVWLQFWTQDVTVYNDSRQQLSTVYRWHFNYKQNKPLYETSYKGTERSSLTLTCGYWSASFNAIKSTQQFLNNQSEAKLVFSGGSWKRPLILIQMTGR